MERSWRQRKDGFVGDEESLKSCILYLLEIPPVVTSKLLPLFLPRFTLFVYCLLSLVSVWKKTTGTTYLLRDSADVAIWVDYLHSLWSQLKEKVSQVYLDLKYISKMKCMNWLNQLPFYERTTLAQFSRLL